MALISSRNLLSKQLLKLNVRTSKKIFRAILSDTLSSRNVSSGDGFSNTTLLMQDGINIEELPLVVKRVSTRNATQLLFSGESVDCPQTDHTANEVPHLSKGIPEKEEIQEMVEGFKRCNSFHEILKLLEVVPLNYVEAVVAFQIVKKMIEVEHVYSIVGDSALGDEVTNNFTKTAVSNQLMDIVLSASDSSVLVNCLRLMNRSSAFRKHFQQYKQRLIDQIMLMVSQNAFAVPDVCEIAKEFHDLGLTNDIDKLWVGIVEKADSIDHSNIMNVYHSLPYFKTSRSIIANTLLNKMTDCWWSIGSRDLAEILAITQKTRTHSYKLLQILGRWLNTKIHSITEDELLLIVNGFSKIEFVNSQVIAALERYVKVRGENIKNASLFAGIMDYCMKFRIRSVPILEKCCDYFIAKGGSLSPAVVNSLFVPFGNLNYSPVRSYEFWKTFEETTEEKFAYFSPEHVVEMLLACVFLERYPINFVNSVFDPYFLNRLQATCKNWLQMKKKLMLFDHIMTFECKAYTGPLLSREYPVNSVVPDERIRFMMTKLREPLVQMTASADRVMFNKCVRVCPLQSICTVDVLLAPADAKVPYLNNFNGTENPFVALLIHLPEHYTLEEDYLIGAQVTRKRHLAQLGLVVVSLNYSQLLKLSSNRYDLLRYVNDAIEEAESSHRRV